MNEIDMIILPIEWNEARHTHSTEKMLPTRDLLRNRSAPVSDEFDIFSANTIKCCGLDPPLYQYWCNNKYQKSNIRHIGQMGTPTWRFRSSVIREIWIFFLPMIVWFVFESFLWAAACRFSLHRTWFLLHQQFTGLFALLMCWMGNDCLVFVFSLRGRL